MNFLQEPAHIKHGILVPWICFYSLAAGVRSNRLLCHASDWLLGQVGCIAFVMKIRLLVQAIRLRREEIDFHEDENGNASPRSKLLKHKKNHARTSRTIQGNSHTYMH